jgi:hypothetical protein
MKIPAFLFCSFWLVFVFAGAQATLLTGSSFPAVTDFPEFQKMLSEESFDKPARIEGLEDGRLILDVGFETYARRIYSAGESGEIAVAITTLMDFRAAYSLLTLRSSTSIQQGPPGDAYAADSTSIRFFQGRQWVRIDGRKASGDLLRRVALFVSNQLGPRGQKPPSLIRHFPAIGYDASSVKYFPGLKSFESYSGSQAFKSLHLNSDAEIAQARYALDNKTGTLTLLNLPTPEVGEEYFTDFSAASSNGKQKEKTYLKRAGPLVAVLKGQMDPQTADKILGAISHSYAIRWIYEKPKKKGIAWGIPVRILHTVAKSILFVILLCVIAILAGAGFAFLRFERRRRSSQDAPDWLGRTDSTRLRPR